MSRLCRILGQRAVWREAHAHLRRLHLYTEDSDPEWGRCYARARLRALREFRVLAAWVARR